MTQNQILLLNSSPLPNAKRTQVWRKATLIRWCLFKVRETLPLPQLHSSTAGSNTATWASNPNAVISPRAETPLLLMPRAARRMIKHDQ